MAGVGGDRKGARDRRGQDEGVEGLGSDRSLHDES